MCSLCVKNMPQNILLFLFPSEHLWVISPGESESDKVGVLVCVLRVSPIALFKWISCQMINTLKIQIWDFKKHTHQNLDSLFPLENYSLVLLRKICWNGAAALSKPRAREPPPHLCGLPRLVSPPCGYCSEVQSNYTTVWRACDASSLWMPGFQVESWITFCFRIASHLVTYLTWFYVNARSSSYTKNYFKACHLCY